MGCQCSNVPANVRIIRVGESEVGIIELEEIIRGVYFLKLQDEVRLKDELFKRVREKNWIPEGRKDAYTEALFREYLAYTRSRRSPRQAEKRTAGGAGGLRSWLSSLRRSRNERKESSWKYRKY
ncbi:MAG: hypothetical protein WCC06_08845 [Candidatus Aminicenantales bacterium]